MRLGKWNMNINSVKIIISLYPICPYLYGKKYPIKCYKFIFSFIDLQYPKTLYQGWHHNAGNESEKF